MVIKFFKFNSMCMYVYVFICVFVFVCMYMCMFVCMYVCMYACVYMLADARGSGVTSGYELTDMGPRSQTWVPSKSRTCS